MTNTSGHMMNKWAQRIKSLLMMQIVDKIAPKIVNGINVSDFTETSKSPLLKAKNNTNLKKSNVYSGSKRSRHIPRLVNDAINHLNEGLGSSAKSIKRLIVSRNPCMDERLLGMQIKRYIKNCLVIGAMIRTTGTFKLKKKYGDRLKEWAKERENALKQEMTSKMKAKENVKKAGNSAYIPKPEKANEKTVDIKDEMAPEKSPSPEYDKDSSVEKPNLKKSPKKVPQKFKPADGKPSKTPTAKTKKKKKARKAIKFPTIPPHPKSVKNVNVMSTVSNMKIRKLQQPMERARQNRRAL